TWSHGGTSPKGGQSWAPRGGLIVTGGLGRETGKGLERSQRLSLAGGIPSNGGSAFQLARLLHERLGVADLELARRLDVERLDDAVLDEHRIALRANAHAARRQGEGQAGRLGEVGAAVGHHADLPRRLLVARPSAHH